VRDRTRTSFLEYLSQRGHQNLRIYLDGGTIRDGIALTRKVARQYRELGWRDGRDFSYHEEKGAEHNERYWRERVWRALVFLFGTRAASD
jgi:enterochelin esterase-like enzyme